MASYRNRYGILINYAFFGLNILSCLMCIRGPSSTCHARISEIKPGEELRSPNELVSSRGVFTLGFFSTSSSVNYLGIWYTTDPSDKKVWIGNRNNPLSKANGSLSLDDNGILKILDGHGLNPIMLNSANRAANNSRATLTDSGNFVLEELNDDGSTKRVLWESFDDPVDTLLPGMKLGINFTTGKRWSLTSWISSELAAPGTFSLDWDWEKTELVMRCRGEVYWTSGVLDEWNSSFVNLPSLRQITIDYSFRYVLNEDSSYLYYSVTTKKGFSVPNVYWLNLDIDGKIWDATGTNHLVGDACYGYAGTVPSPGCVKEKSEKCRVLAGGEVDRFYPHAGGYMLPEDSNYWPLSNESVSIGISDCWATCWNNCSCIAYSSYNPNDSTGCIFWSTGTTFFLAESIGIADKFILNSVFNKTNRLKSAKKWWIWVIISLVAVLVALLLGWLFYIRRRKLKEAKEKYEEEILFELTTSTRFNDAIDIGDDGNKGREVKLFSFASILAATNNFSSENKLGQGGFGPVYKGTLPDGRKIAVKRLSRGSGQGLVEFKNEIVLIAKLQHTNLVRLFGCCIQGDDEKMLIYEYMPNKSLDFFLFDPKKKEVLDWQKRYDIIEGIAQGLLYLHKYSRFKVIHRDMKVSNILLDDEMNPKISDFGLAKIFERNVNEGTTNRVVGTYGYMSPEYAMEGIFSEKSDVYSFGVLVLEIVSGRKNSSFYQYDNPTSMVSYAWQLWRERSIMEMMDSSLSDIFRHQIFRCIHLSLLCVQDSVADRPTMSDVISMLSNETMPLPAPKEPASVSRSSAVNVDTYNNKDGMNIYTINNVSLTVMEPR